MDYTGNITFLTYNVHGSYNLANLSLIIEVYKPKIIFLQEVKLSTEQLMAFGRKLDYLGAANIDELDHNKPGTGFLWHSSLPITQVIPLYPCRVQVAMMGAYPLVNVYVPAGSHRSAERRHFFVEWLFGLVAGQEDILPVMAGDWNCVLEKLDLENGTYFNDRKSLDLENIIQEFKYIDAFRHLHGRRREYTWQGRDGASASRLDRIYIPDWMAPHLVSMAHHTGYSDHKFGLMELSLPNILKIPKQIKYDSGYWKMNSAILEDRDFQLNFDKLWQGLEEEQGGYEDLADWWDEFAKPEIRIFLQNFSATLARTRRDLKELLCFMLDKAMAEKNWNEVAMVRGKLQTIMFKDNMGFVVRSRFKENQEVERASLYHINREKKNAQGGNLESLMIGGKVETARKKVEPEVINFFGNLFTGKHGRNGVETNEPFQPDYTELDDFLEGLGKLSDESRDIIEKPIVVVELELALEKAANNKSPGLDGIPYELYKKTGEKVSETLVAVMNAQLERLKLMLSNTQGVTRLTPKTEPGVVPRVDQLRPITLLCCDYKLLTMILSNRMMRIMHEIILSGQLCSVTGKNIHFGTHNLLSSLIYMEERVEHAETFGFGTDRAGGGVLLSYDLFKAYDRVSIGYLVKVMRAMGFGDKFVSWILMLHEGADTRFLLNFLTKPVKILISVRQGDPIAMGLFIIFVEPLLLMIRRKTQGFPILGLENRLGRLPVDLFMGVEERLFVQRDEDFVDDVNVLVKDPEDMLVIDIIFDKFERFSGAILNRSEKTKLMGIGHFRDRQRWPLDWIKVVKSLRIFGVTLFPTYMETLEFNWAEAKRKLEKCLNSWNTRVLNSVYQRVEMLNIFALPKLWYLAECLPLPASWAGEMEKLVYSFIKIGKMEMMALQEMSNPVDKGGLGLVCVRSKADSLFLKQTLRMLSQPGTLQWKFVRFFAGHEFRIGELCGVKHHNVPPYFAKMVELYEEGRVMEICWHCYCCADVSCKKKMLKTTAKEIYTAYTGSFPPPRVEYKPEYRNLTSVQWDRVWERVASPMLDPMARQVVWRAVNNILPTRERLNRLGLMETNGRQVISSRCNRCDLRLVDSVCHMFTECGLVREAWCWTRRRVMSMLPDDMADLSNTEIIHMMFPSERMENELVWVVGNYMGWVHDEAVTKGRVLTAAHARAYFKYLWYQSKQTRMPQIVFIQDITTDLQQNVVFDNG